MSSYSKDRFIKYVNNVIDSNKISHAYLIELNDYEDDYKYVLDFIKMILCNIKYEELTNSDNPIINMIDNEDYPDLYVVSTNTSVINKMLISELQKEFANTSLLNNKKIYIIKEAEKLNAASANTILKFLEEPGENIIAFLLTDNRYHIIETILSRCQVLSLLDDQNDIEIDDKTIDLLDYIVNPKNYFINYNEFMKNIFVDKSDFIEQINKIEGLIVSYIDKTNTNNIDLLSKKTTDDYVNIISILEEEIPKLNYNVNMKLWLDSLFSRLIGG